MATDDEKIAACCQGFGAEVIMTSESCRNGKHNIHLLIDPNFATSGKFQCLKLLMLSC